MRCDALSVGRCRASFILVIRDFEKRGAPYLWLL
jgi:hypothetical protein